MRIDLIKYQALGNDYLVLDLPAPLDEVVEILPEICDRHRGLGSDGLLAFDAKAMTVRIFNPDRPEAQESGNGLRIAADLAARCEGEPGRVRLDTVARSVEAMLVAVGNPHCVVFGQAVTKERCLELGPHLETHPAFPERT